PVLKGFYRQANAILLAALHEILLRLRKVEWTIDPGAQTDRQGVAGRGVVSEDFRWKPGFTGGCHESGLHPPPRRDVVRLLGNPIAEGAGAVSQPGVAVESIVSKAAGGDIQVAIGVEIA